MSTYHGVIRFDAVDDASARRQLALKAAQFPAEILGLARVRQVLDPVSLEGMPVAKDGPLPWEEEVSHAG
jgi:hypothetical protein